MGNNFHLIIAGAGESKRFGKDKLFLRVKGKRIIEWSFYNLLNLIKFDKIAIVLNPKKLKERNISKIFEKFIIVGGEEKRALSVYNGFLAISPKKNDFVVIHDGARPYVPKKLIKNLLKEIKKEKGVIPVTPVKETIKKLKNNYVYKTIKRESLFFVQTPQIFKAKFLYDAYNLPQEKWENLTDESQLFEILKVPVKTIEGSPLNIKLTFKEDIFLIKDIL